MKFFKYPDESRWALVGRWPFRMEFAVYSAHWRLQWTRFRSWHRNGYALDLGPFQFLLDTPTH